MPLPRRLRPRPLVAAAALAAAALAAAAAAAAPAAAQPPTATPAAAPPGPPATPCLERAESRRFDFWAGEWEVRTPAGQPAGRNSVRRVAGGCGLQEWWTAANGSTGTSLNAFNRETGQWQQFWVGQFGAVTEYRRSEWAPDGSLVLHADGRRPDGTAYALRMTFTPRSADLVRQHIEQSLDGGTTWTTLTDLHYHRVRGGA
jgi:hypothetical protein